MRCPDCGHDVPDSLSLCPHCGLNVEATQPIRKRRASKAKRSQIIDDTVPIPVPPQVGSEAAASRIPLMRRIMLVFIAFVVFLLLLVTAGTVGVYTGFRQGELAQTATAVAAVETASEEHYRLGITYMDQGEYELAIAEFGLAIEINPNHQLAPVGLSEAQALLAAMPTPTVEATVDLPAELYLQGTAAYGEENWEDAIRTLGQLRAIAPGYETALVESMLFRSLSTYGLELLGLNRIEEGIFYLDQAQEIQPLSDDVLWERNIANRYLTAVGYWGVDWERCVQRFQDLYTLAPGYRDVAFKLFQAHVEYGDLWAETGEMCPAAEQYSLALELVEDIEVVQKHSDASEVCAVATPTPIPPITGTLPVTTTVSIPGFYGRLAYSVNDEIFALIGDGANARLLKVSTAADQPCWQWGSNRIIYRNRPNSGISMRDLGSDPIALPAEYGAAWPTLSSDGGRYSFAARDDDGIWHVYMATLSSPDPPIIWASGWEPTWGPTGLLAWTGCEAEGSVCGIFIDNPDDEEPPQRYTASANDSGIHWHPNGDRLAYMSDHTGNWDIYMLGVSGGIAPLSEDPSIEALPAWSPDGNSLAFLSYRDGSWGIYMMQADGSNVRQIVDLGPDTPPNWRNQRLSWTQ